MLKPCPFCGSSDIDIDDDNIDQTLQAVFIARCNGCGARTRINRNRTSAEEAWNARSNP